MPRTSTSGFTMVELIIAITVSGILAGLLFGPLNDLYKSNITSSKKIAQIGEAHNSLRTTQDLITKSTGFLSTNVYNASTNPNGVNDPYSANNNWSASAYNSNNGVLITSNYATTVETNSISSGSSNAGTQTIALDNTTGNCLTAPALINNYVYFVNNYDHSLYRRTLKNLTAVCNGGSIIQKQSCGLKTDNSINTAAYCATRDAKLASSVTAFNVVYLANPEDNPVSQHISDPTQASTVVLTLTTQDTSGTTSPGSTTTTLRVTHIN
jgi:prepilin-type N-terminal cleavage/methylation domain-containing protein